MNKVILSSVAFAVLMFSGCSSHKPAVDETTGVKAPVSQGETSSSEGMSTGSTETPEEAMARIEKEMGNVYFDFDKFDIREDMKSNVTTDVAVAKAAAAAYNVKLEGNCDEWGSDEYNFALGLKRAQAVKTALVNDGVDAKRISMVSLGKSTPVCTEKTKECWGKNRRVDFKLLP